MSDKVLHINDEQFDHEVLNSDKPVLVDFWANWCGPCKMIGPFIEELAEELPDVKFVKVDIDQNSTVATKLGVMSIPNLVLFKNGEIINRQIGALPKNELKAFIENSLN
ncbi:MAG: thioredoxin [Aeromonadales bacterium]|nr:thioredoxin [Aeromonadales bacterium]